MTHTRLTHPSMTNDPRHVTSAISHATIGGVTALPSRANAWVMPCAKPRRPSGVQFCIARVATGNVAPSPIPTSRRHEEQRHETAGEAGQDGRRRPDQAAQEQRAPRTEAIADPAAEDLKEQIRIAERRLQEAELRVRQPELFLNVARGGRDVDPIDVRDQVHHAQQTEDDRTRRRRLQAHRQRGYRLHQ